jgi:hypothetical protein
MPNSHADLGTVAWVQRTSGRLSSAEKRSLVGPLVHCHARNAVGRLAMAMRLNPGRRAYVPTARLLPPDTLLTRAAEERARRLMPAVLVNHSFRSYIFGSALGAVEGIDVDTELLFAAAMLHDVGLVNPRGDGDFTLTSARVARDVADRVGLSMAASTQMQTAIALHPSPGLSAADGTVAYLLSAGAAADGLGLRTWELPVSVLTDAVRQHPRLDLKDALTATFANEAARVPHGRVRLLRRYGALDAAIRFAPFDS